MLPDLRDIDDEIKGHLALEIQQRIERGEDPAAARLAALKQFGYIPQMREQMRQVWYSRWVDAAHDLTSDVRYALRSLSMHRAFSLTVIGVLALGIGLNAAVFTMVKGMLLSPISGVKRSGQMAVLFAETSTGRDVRVSYPDYRDLRDHQQAFSDLFGTSLVTVSLGRGRAARQLSGELVTGNYFSGLGVRAQLGRTLQPSDEVAPSQHPVVVISNSLWRRDFSADPDIVGKTIELNNVPLTIVGVADASFHGTVVSYDIEVFIPIMMAPQFRFNFERTATTAPPADPLSDRYTAMLSPHGYLRPGTSMAVARAELEAMWATLSRERTLDEAGQQLRVVRFWQSPTGGQVFILPTMIVLSAMGLLVLMIACANIAGLVLVRGISRRGEIAVRSAMGASRRRIVRLLVIENLVLALPGALLGLVFSWRAIPPLVAYAEQLSAPQRIYFNASVNGIDIAFVALVAVMSALLFGLVPALQSSRVNLVSVINQDASPRGAARGHLRTGLVVAQVAVSLLLLIGSGLTTKSVEAARRADPGFDRDHVAVVGLDLKQNGYDEARGRVFYRTLLDILRADPRFESVSLGQYHPLGLLDTRMLRVSIDGYEPRKDEDLAFMANTVGPDYFRTLRINMIAGRPFEDRDNQAAQPVIIVNNTLAERFWGSAANALGRHMSVANGESRTVIGVAADLKYSRINEAPRPYFYQPIHQVYRTAMVLYVRGGGSVDALANLARAHVTSIDPDLPVLYARAFTTGGAFIFYDFTAMMLFIFGLAGMALAALGTYGLVSYAVKQSTREIGIRMALGANHLTVVRGFLARGLRLGLIGAALGIVAALSVSGLLSSVLFGVSTTDVMAFTQALAIVLGVVTVATILPAWRATRTKPLNALRHQ